jgi:hypothetical protein
MYSCALTPKSAKMVSGGLAQGLLSRRFGPEPGILPFWGMKSQAYPILTQKSRSFWSGLR